jgi:hypothetical protein
MFGVQKRYKWQVEFKNIQFANGKWYAWYVADIEAELRAGGVDNG